MACSMKMLPQCRNGTHHGHFLWVQTTPELDQGSILLSTFLCALKLREGSFLIKPVFQYEIGTRILGRKVAKPVKLLLNLDRLGSLLESCFF